MKRKNYLAAVSLIALSAISTYLATVYTVTGNAQISPARQPETVPVNEYQVAAVLFMQRAAEYRALAYQAFNTARMTLDADLDKKNLNRLPKLDRKKQRAVVVDVDETVLDNSPHQAFLIRQRTAFTPSVWTEWVNKRAAKPIPGAVDFLNYAHRRGARIFYVTNRNAAEKQGTIDNLRAVGFPDVSEETVMVRADTSSKEARRDAIEQQYRIVILIGDNLNDLSDIFENKSVNDRFFAVEQTRELFGRRFIVLPNVMYGDWENAVYEYKRGLTETQKAEMRANALQLP